MPRPCVLAKELARGVARSFAQRGYTTLLEFPLHNGRRADLIGLGRDGGLVIVEVKSSAADFRSDHKWPEYRGYCDRLYFAVAADFPAALIPEDCGLIVADPFGGSILREAPEAPLAAGRRRALTLRFARIAASRLARLVDPAALVPEPG